MLRLPKISGSSIVLIKTRVEIALIKVAVYYNKFSLRAIYLKNL